MATADAATEVRPGFAPYAAPDRAAQMLRIFAWSNIAVLGVFLINNFLIHWIGLPGVEPLIEGSEEVGALAWLQTLAYPAAIGVVIWRVMATSTVALRADSKRISDMNAYFIRACFWMVVFIGVGDFTISFMGVEGLLQPVFGEEIGSALNRSQFRGPYVHIPLALLGFVAAAFTRTLGVHWLAALVVLAELLIVIGRFIFSYEQAFMGDLVRFWYAALFLFASAYTLLEDGHVRVDVFYAAFRQTNKGRVNAIGAVLFGLSLCWVVILFGMWGKANVINAPILAFELGQQSSGLYIKYLLAAFIGIFAISMLAQFCAALLDGAADARDEPGHREGSHASAS